MGSQTKIIPPGSFVLATRGRDAGGLFITLGRSEDGNYLLIADGKTRKVQKPKRKKVIHIEVTALPPIEITDLTNKKAQAAVKRHLRKTEAFNC